ncbi:hypothetical protein Csa_023778, partial [Cucumis sativus]
FQDILDKSSQASVKANQAIQIINPPHFVAQQKEVKVNAELNVIHSLKNFANKPILYNFPVLLTQKTQS